MNNYTFHEYQTCELCSSPKSQFKYLGKRLNGAQGWFPKRKQGHTTPIYQCKNCGLLFCHPVPLPLSVEQHYGMDPNEYWKDQNVVESTDNAISYLRPLLEHYLTLQNAYFLDIGSGMGNDLNAAKQMGFNVLGIEPSSAFRTASIAKFSLAEHEVILSDWAQSELPVDHFDFISFGAVLEHLPFPGKALQKAISHLKAGGLIHLQVPNSRWLTARFINFVYRFTGNGYVCNLSPLHAPFHLFEFHKTSFESFASTNKLDIVHLQYDICDTMLPKQLDWLVKPIMKVSNSGMELNVLYRKQ